jgi:site-specific DNA-methyltransferase (adenine-specific)
MNEQVISLIHGDCVEALKKIDKSNCIIVTDPPFNIGYKYNSYKDIKKESEYYKWLCDICEGVPTVMVHYPESLHRFSIERGEAPINVVSWVYNSNTAKQHRDIAFYGVKPDFRKVGQPYKNPTDKRIAKRISEGKKARLYDWWNVNQVKNVSKTHSHPCQMPEKVMENIVGLLPEGATVIDPFLGSGSTGLACKKLGVDFIGVELDAEYLEIAKARIGGEQSQ